MGDIKGDTRSLDYSSYDDNKGMCTEILNQEAPSWFREDLQNLACLCGEGFVIYRMATVYSHRSIRLLYPEEHTVQGAFASLYVLQGTV